MKVKLYVSWRREENITEAKLEKIIAGRQLDRREDRDCMVEDIDEYLDPRDPKETETEMC